MAMRSLEINKQRTTRVTLGGINVQYPITKLIITGKKTVETRTYPLPELYVGKEVFLVETPGTQGKFKARIIAIVKFSQSFHYRTKKEFYADFPLHQVSPDSPWAWTTSKKKWGWPVEVVKVLKTPVVVKKKKGIKYTKKITISF
jgi:hypothetical protein